MSLEPSHKRTEQERTRSATSAETDHSLAIQGDSGGEQLPATVTPAPVPPNPDELVDLLLSWIRTPDWSASQTYLQAHPELLTEAAAQVTEAAAQVLATLTQHQSGRQIRELLMLHQQLLQIAGQQGVEAAYQTLLYQEEKNDSAATEQEELQAQVIAWLQTPDWETSQTYLQSHPQLLTDAAEQMMEALKGHQREQEAQTMINLHQTLLQKVRVEGIEAAYERFLTPESEMLPNDQEVVVDQALQDPAIWHDAGKAALDQYLASGRVANLNRAVECWHEALKLTPSNSPNWPALLNNLGAGLSYRYKRTGNPADLDAAISLFQQAVQATPPDSPDRPARLNNLGGGLSNRYAHTGSLADLDAAISAFRQAVQATPSDLPDWPAYLNNLGTGLCTRYAQIGDLADLEAAISAFQQAIQATPADSPDQPTLLSNMGSGLHNRSARTGDLADLEAAISAFQQAVQAVSSNSPNQSAFLNNLGGALRDRYTRTGALADLEAAINAHQQAIQTTPSDSPNRPRYLNNLGIGLIDRYAHTGDLADLEAAISAFQQAVQTTPSDSPDRPGYLSSLGSGLSDRYTRTGALADLEAAISAFQQAVQATSSNSPNRPGYLSNLGSGLSDRYKRTGNLADLDAAITVIQQAVQTSPSNSPDRPTLLNNLGLGLRARYARTGNLVDLGAAISAWERSWSLPHPRLAALPVTYQLGQQRLGVGVATRLVTAYLEQAKQHHPRSLNVPHRALEIAEGSKSRLLTQLVGRGSLPLPSGLSPEVAARELQFLAELTALDTQELVIHDHFAPSQEETSHLQRLQQRQAALRGLEDLWAQIARLGPEGTEYVALRRGAVPTWQELTRLTMVLGPATALLSFFRTTDRALLFLLRANWRAPRLVEGPLNQTGWADLLERFFREVHCYSPGLRRSETWDQPLRPLFTEAQSYLKGVERLILAPAGPGHLLPWGVLVERASWHTSDEQPLPLATLPALGILPRLRQRPHVPPGPALVIGNPRGDLPYAEGEANAVAERFGTKPLLRAAATKSAVLTRLPEATLIHLATHASFDPDNPLESKIALADGELTAREVLRHRLQADLLVLSACESGQVGSLGGEELAGLSQAFLQAGVRSLLVSLWQVNDPATAALMQAFYTARQAGADKALALRQAMTQIQQDRRWSHPYYWGAFVLVGDWE